MACLEKLDRRRREQIANTTGIESFDHLLRDPVANIFKKYSFFVLASGGYKGRFERMSILCTLREGRDSEEFVHIS